MFEEHHEGKITFLRPPLQKVPTTSMPVFYNPQSELNRDITICGIQVFLNQAEKTGATVCTPLAGTGVRAIRIAKEVQGIQRVVAGDVNPLAVDLIEKNCRLNDVQQIVEVRQSDANVLLAQHHQTHRKFDIIDIDPFGSPRDFLATSIGALRSIALLCMTATDIPVLIGIRRRACVKRYAAEPARTEYGHELAVRVLIGCAIREAAAQNFGLRPLLSFYIDHYVRLFCEASKGDEAAWTAISQLGYLLHCDTCGHRHWTKMLVPITQVCPQCHATKVQRAGPIWTGHLADRVFVNETIRQIHTRSLGTNRRLIRLLQRLLEELDGPPTFYNLHRLADNLDIPVPAFDTIINALRSRGYFCTRTHFSPYAIRTSAPQHVLKNVLQQIVRGELTQ